MHFVDKFKIFKPKNEFRLIFKVLCIFNWFLQNWFSPLKTCASLYFNAQFFNITFLCHNIPQINSCSHTKTQNADGFDKNKHKVHTRIMNKKSSTVRTEIKKSIFYRLHRLFGARKISKILNFFLFFVPCAFFLGNTF